MTISATTGIIRISAATIHQIAVLLPASGPGAIMWWMTRFIHCCLSARGKEKKRGDGTASDHTCLDTVLFRWQRDYENRFAGPLQH